MLTKNIQNIFRITLLSIFLGFAFSNHTRGQVVYHHTSNKPIYEFLDEMAALQIIDLNSAIKPYSRVFIANKLKKIQQSDYPFTKRQRKELAFYLKDFNKELKPAGEFDKRYDLLFRKDSLFTLTINPILGIHYFTNDSSDFYHRWNGARAWGYVGKHFGAYASLRDNHESFQLSDESYINHRMGANYKGTKDGGGDYSEMRGGLTWSWKWGTIGLVKDHFSWGDHKNGANIFSGKTPSTTHLKLHIKPVDWFELNYVHGWLISEIVDSTESYIFNNHGETDRRDVFREKYLAANFFTFKPFDNFHVSFGNSIIYSDNEIRPEYLIPVFFYKSVDHTLNATDKPGENAGQNSQMFFNISSRNLKYTHIYSSLFIDEIAIGRMTDPDEHTNFYSWKIGMSVHNFPINNLSLNTEYTRTNPVVYKHDVPTTTFETNGYNLGHYLRDNAEELFVKAIYKPLSQLRISMSYTHARKGNDYPYDRGSVKGLPFMKEKKWISEQLVISASYQIINDGYIFARYKNSYKRGELLDLYTPEVYKGKLNTFSAGMNFSF
jgi:hypothetical protein